MLISEFQGERSFELYIEPTLFVITILHVMTLLVFKVDPRLQSGAGNLLRVYLSLIVCRNTILLISIIVDNPIILVISIYFDLSSVMCQLKTVYSIWKNVNSKVAANESRSRTDNLLCQFFIVIGLSCLYLLLGLVILVSLHFFLGVFCTKCIKVVKAFDISLMTCWPLPVALANTLMCVITALRVRAVRKITEGPDFQRLGREQTSWYWLLVKVILVSGVQTDVLYVMFTALIFTVEYYDQPLMFNLTVCAWSMKGFEVFIVFVCKKEVWKRNVKKLTDYIRYLIEWSRT